jgi:twitching motility two-component system response regulator PilH
MSVKRVLVVDDSATERFFLTELLTKNGFAVSAAENAEEALIKVKTTSPDLILMDVVMPGQNGFQLTRALSKDPATQNIPIIMCTSKGRETDKIWGMRQGALAYLVKPVAHDELLARIRAMG